MWPQLQQQLDIKDIKLEVSIKEEILDHDTLCQQQQQQLDPQDIKVEVELKEEEENNHAMCMKFEEHDGHLHSEEVKGEVAESVCIFKNSASPKIPNVIGVGNERKNLPTSSSSRIQLENNDETFILPDFEVEHEDHHNMPVDERDNCGDPLSSTNDGTLEDQVDGDGDDDNNRGDSEIFTYRGKWTYEAITETRPSGKTINKYKCSSCGRKSSNHRFMIDHVRTKHYEVDDINIPVLCGNGEYIYMEKWKYVRMTGSEHHKCLTCDLVVSQKKLILEHIDKVHCNGTPMCVKCARLFEDDVQLNSHVCPAMKGSYRPRCSITENGDGKFLFYSKWQAHLEGNFYVCDSCGAKKKVMEMMTRHITLIHEDPARYPCHKCHKWFPSLGSLKHHLPVHNNYRRKYSREPKHST